MLRIFSDDNGGHVWVYYGGHPERFAPGSVQKPDIRQEYRARRHGQKEICLLQGLRLMHSDTRVLQYNRQKGEVGPNAREKDAVDSVSPPHMIAIFGSEFRAVLVLQPLRRPPQSPFAP